MDYSRYTMPVYGSERLVRIGEFREQIAHLEQVVRRDWRACANDTERARCVEVMRRIGGALMDMVSKRATVADMDRRESAIEASASIISKFEIGPIEADALFGPLLAALTLPQTTLPSGNVVSLRAYRALKI